MTPNGVTFLSFKLLETGLGLKCSECQYVWKYIDYNLQMAELDWNAGSCHLNKCTQP